MSWYTNTDPTADPYPHLPPLPLPLCKPGYDTGSGAIETQRNKADSQYLYAACRDGDLSAVETWLEGKASQPKQQQPEAKDLEFALEEACHNFNIPIVRRLLGGPGSYLLEDERTVKIHYRCFRRELPASSSSPIKDYPLNILGSDSSQLIDLLKVFLEAGWHPNQLLGPPYTGRNGARIQEVALHYPRCLRDQDILKLLLDAGADPTIARWKKTGPPMLGAPAEVAGIERMSGDILELAVNFATPTAVDLLLGHGAILEKTPVLQSLVRRSKTAPTDWTDDIAKYLSSLKKPDAASNTTTVVPSPKTFLPPESPYPRSDERFIMAEHLLKIGVHINAQHDVYVPLSLSQSE